MFVFRTEQFCSVKVEGCGHASGIGHRQLGVTGNTFHGSRAPPLQSSQRRTPPLLIFQRRKLLHVCPATQQMGDGFLLVAIGFPSVEGGRGSRGGIEGREVGGGRRGGVTVGAWLHVGENLVASGLGEAGGAREVVQVERAKERREVANGGESRGRRRESVVHFLLTGDGQRPFFFGKVTHGEPILLQQDVGSCHRLGDETY